MVKTTRKLALISLMSMVIQQVQAAPVLLGIGSLGGGSDKSGLTNALESGVNANVLGGLGSGLAYVGDNRFIALPDRGPNAESYIGGAPVDNTTSYISRVQTLSMTLTPSSSGLPFTITPTLDSTTLLFNATPLTYGTNGAPQQNNSNRYFFSGRSDNFGPGDSLNASNGRFDPEGVRVSNDGKSVFISDEYGPYVYQFDRLTGERTKVFSLPSNLAATNLSASGDTEISTNSVGRVANKGMEGLAITPDGKTLVGVMQAPLAQDTNKNIRIVTIDIASGATQQFAYKLTDGSGVSEILAINDHEFLLAERDGKGLGDNSDAVAKKVYRIDLSGAQDVSNLAGDLTSKAVAKTQVLDVKAALVAAGIAAKNIPAKMEGMTFGADVIFNNVNMHTLWIANDNDFLDTITDSKHPMGFANPNNFYVFGFSDADLPRYVAQNVSTRVPEASSIGLLSLSLLALAALRRRTR